MNLKTGKGWKESPDASGKAPRHKAVATKKKLGCTLKKPMEKMYYSSNPPKTVFKFSEFIDVEIEERGNYPDMDTDAIKKKYGLTDNSEVIWVTPLKWMANRYNLSEDEYDNAENIPEGEMSVYEYSSNQGFVIPETNDGDDGFLFVMDRSQ